LPHFAYYGFAIAFPLALAALIWYGRSQQPDPRPLGLGELWYLAILPGAVFIGLPLLQLRAAFTHLRQHRVPHTAHTISVSEQGVRASCVAAASEVRWEALHKVVETGEFFLFYYAPKCAFYLPKRALSDRDAQTVRLLAHTHAGDRSTLCAPAA